MKKWVWLSIFVFMAGVAALLQGCGGQGRPYDPILTGGGSGFTLSIAPASQTINVLAARTRLAAEAPAQSVRYTVTVSPTGSFSGKVDLSVANPNGSGFSASLDVPSVTLTGGMAQTATLTVGLTSSWDSQFGKFTFPVTGVNGQISMTQNAVLNVTSGAMPDFSVQVTPPSQAMPNGDNSATGSGRERSTRRSPGTSQTALEEDDFTIKITPAGGFTGTVALTIQNPNSSIFSTSFDSSSLVVNSSASQSTNLRVKLIKGTTATGPQTFTVTANGGSLSHTGSATVTLTVYPFAIFSTAGVTIDQNGEATSQPTTDVGNVYGVGPVLVENGSQVFGLAESVATVSLQTGGTAETTQSHIQPLPVPTLDTASFKSKAAQQGSTNGNVTFTNQTANLKGLINGNVTLQGSKITVTGPLYITGNLVVESNSNLDPGPIYVEGTVDIDGSSVNGSLSPLGIVCLASNTPTPSNPNNFALAVNNFAGLSGVAFCPNGAATVNGESAINDTLVCNGALITGNSGVWRFTNRAWPLH